MTRREQVAIFDRHALLAEMPEYREQADGLSAG